MEPATYLILMFKKLKLKSQCLLKILDYVHEFLWFLSWSAYSFPWSAFLSMQLCTSLKHKKVLVVSLDLQWKKIFSSLSSSELKYLCQSNLFRLLIWQYDVHFKSNRSKFLHVFHRYIFLRVIKFLDSALLDNINQAKLTS